MTIDLRQALQLHLQRGIQHWGIQFKDEKYYVKITGGFDGRSDDKEYNWTSTYDIDTSHVLVRKSILS